METHAYFYYSLHTFKAQTRMAPGVMPGQKNDEGISVITPSEKPEFINKFRKLFDDGIQRT